MQSAPRVATVLLGRTRRKVTNQQRSETIVIDEGLVLREIEFNSESEAYHWYNDYAEKVRFSIRKEYGKKDKEKKVITNRRFVCYKEGYRQKDKRSKSVKRPRKETRVGCTARMTIAIRPNGKYRIIDFEPNHNHEVADASIVHILPSQRRITDAHAIEIELADNSGIRPKLAFELLSRHAGGRESIGFLNRDHRNYLRSKRKYDLKDGEAGTILNYFSKQSLENPSFFSAMQTDIDNQITNMFWADAKMIIDYSHFGDVIFFDTTYRTNKECRPFGAFVGLNHHYQQVVFGASLLYDETAESFAWLFETFLSCMSKKKPITIFTDQDAAMAKAINLVMPETHHRLCIWHIHQNALKHVNHLFRESKSFMKSFNACIYDCEDEDEFLKYWEIMLEKFQVRDNLWLKGLFNVKEKWAMVYGREHFSAGKKSTQLSESFNSHLRNYLKSDLDLVQFFKHFERAVDDRRYNETLANHDISQRIPILKVNIPLLKHARDVYTEAILDMFQDEYEKSLLMDVDLCFHDGAAFEFKVSMCGDFKQFTVHGLTSDGSINCSCKTFEFVGILCSHTLKVLDHMKIKMNIPEKYILKRWTKNARNGCLVDANGNDVKEDSKLEISSFFRTMCNAYVKLVNRGSECKEARDYLRNNVIEVNSKLDGILTNYSNGEHALSTPTIAIRSGPDLSESGTRPIGLKRRPVIERGKSRYKSSIEKKSRKTNASSKNDMKRRGKATKDFVEFASQPTAYTPTVCHTPQITQSLIPVQWSYGHPHAMEQPLFDQAALPAHMISTTNNFNGSSFFPSNEMLQNNDFIDLAMQTMNPNEVEYNF